MFPAELRADFPDACVLAVWSKLEDAQGLGHNHFLLFVVRRRTPVESFQACERTVPALLFLWKHTPHTTLENLGWGTLVEWSPLGVGVRLLADEAQELELVADIYQGGNERKGRDVVLVLSQNMKIGITTGGNANQ